MAVLAGQVNCPSNASTSIVGAANSNTVYSGAGRSRTVVLYNASAWDTYVGPTGANTEFLLKAGVTVTLVMGAHDVILGKASSNTGVIHYLVTGA